MQKLIDLNAGQTLSQGVFPSLGANQPQVWRTSSNVEFPGDRARKATGYTIEVNTSAVYAIAQAFADNFRRAYYAEATDIYSFQGGVSLRLGLGFDSSGFWSLVTWGTWLLATNEVDPPQVWKDTVTDDMHPLAGFTGVRAGRRYRLFKKHQNHVLGYFGQTVDWSHESDPETWVPAVSNSAGSEFIRDLDSDIVAAQPLGQDYGIYSSDSLFIQKYVGEPFYFGFTLAIRGIGAVSDSAIVPVGSVNYGLSSKGFFTTDGISADYIDNPQVNKWFKARFNPGQGRRTVGYHDEEAEMVKWHFIGLDGITIYGLGFNYSKKTWTIIDQPITAAEEKSVFDTPLVATRNSFGFLSGHDAGANPLLTSLTSFPLTAGQRENYKQWDMLRANIEGGGLEIRFGFQDQIEDAVDWTAWTALSIENYIERESVFLTVDLRSTGAGVDWSLIGASIHGEVTGYL